MADELAASGTGGNLKEVVRYVLGLGLGVLVLLLLFGKRAELVAAWHQLSHVDLGWIAAAIGAEAMSLWTFAYLQHRVLRMSGATVPMTALALLTLANDAIANTVPGEPAVSSAYRYRYYRRCGVSGASAGWTIFTILIAQAIGMSLLLLLGVVVALAASATTADRRRRGRTRHRRRGRSDPHPPGSGLAADWRAGAGDRSESPGTRGAASAHASTPTLARMRQIPLSARSTVGIVAIATGVWFCDFLCLVCGFGAVHAAIPADGVLLAYGVAQVVGSIPVIPGGLGIVEGSLAVILAAYGAGRVPALSAALVFRSISFWLAVAVGWISVAVIARQMRRRSRRDRDLAPDPDLQAIGVPPPE